MSVELQALSASFARHLRAEGKAARTITIYTQAVRFFSDWLEAQGKRATLDELTRRNIRDWLSELTATKEPATVKTRHRSLYRFCKWCVEEDELETNPMQGIAAPSLKMKPVPVITDEQLVALMKTCSGKTFDNRRDEAMLRVMLDCGVRVAELVGLTVDDVNLDAEMAIVIGKGSKRRAIYFSPRTTRALDRYARARAGHRWASLDAFFLSQRGALTTDGVRERTKVLGAQAGIPDLHPHQFRHTFAHDFLMNGGQERDLKRLAGWSSDVMLDRYGASAADARAKAAATRLRRGDRV